MQLSVLLLSTLAALSIAAPTSMKKRAVFGATTYDDISISGGVAGNALEEANAILDKLPANPEKADLDFLNSVNQVANDAEVEAFNKALEGATGEEADAIDRGKIKNKVLKLQATVLKLTASGQNPTKLAEEEKKLANNVAKDKAEAGKASTKLPFAATLGSGTATAGEAKADAGAATEAEDTGAATEAKDAGAATEAKDTGAAATEEKEKAEELPACSTK